MDVRQALLKAAVKAFADSGTRGATTRRIAQDAGVNEVTLFRHFQSKEDLLREAMQFFAQQAVHRRLPDAPVNPRAELVAWCQAHHRELHQARALIRRAMGEFEERPEQCATGMQASVRIAHELAHYVGELKRRGLARSDADAMAATAMLMGALFADAMGRDTMPERYPYPMRDAVEKYVDLFLHAIGAADTSRHGAPKETP